MSQITFSSENIQGKGWKHKIEYLHSLAAQIKNQPLQRHHQISDYIWIDLIRDPNLNVVQTAVETLKQWLTTYGINNSKVQIQLLENLIKLAKMGRQSINENIISIVISLFKREKDMNNNNMRIPLQLLDLESFNSSNHPTFLIGSVQSEAIQEAESIQETENLENPLLISPILTFLSKTMQSCKKTSFALCLRIVLSLEEQGLLTESQFSRLRSQIQEISSVIEHRKAPQQESQKKDLKLSQELCDLMCELKQRR